MAVYVDDMRKRYGRMIMCHMAADTPRELFDMGDHLGMLRHWFQSNPYPHFDVSLNNKFKARENGAILITSRELVVKIREATDPSTETGRLWANYYTLNNIMIPRKMLR